MKSALIRFRFLRAGCLLLLTAHLPLPLSAQVNYTPYTFTTLAGAIQQYTNFCFPQCFPYPIPGYADGTGTNAVFYLPAGVAADGSGNVFVADTLNGLIRRVAPDGAVGTIAGRHGVWGYLDGIGTNALFDFPVGLTVDTSGSLYVCEVANNLIRKLTPGAAGWVVTTIAGAGQGIGGLGHADGIGTNASFFQPVGIVANSRGVLYVSDSHNNTIRQLTPVGADWEVTTIAGTPTQIATNGPFNWSGGYSDGIGKHALFSQPLGIAIDTEDSLYVADSDNHVIRKLTRLPPSRGLRKTENWLVSTIAGSAGVPGSADGPDPDARFNRPFGLAMDSTGNLYVGDRGNFTIRKLSRAGHGWLVTTLAGVPALAGSADGTGPYAIFAWPAGVAVDEAGNVYVADQANSTIRKGWPAGQ